MDFQKYHTYPSRMQQLLTVVAKIYVSCKYLFCSKQMCYIAEGKMQINQARIPLEYDRTIHGLEA